MIQQQFCFSLNYCSAVDGRTLYLEKNEFVQSFWIGTLNLLHETPIPVLCILIRCHHFIRQHPKGVVVVAQRANPS